MHFKKKGVNRMSTAQTIIFRNTNKESMAKILEKFKHSTKEVYKKENDIDLLAELYAKNPVDKFIVASFPDVEIAQGDILIWAEGTPMYRENIGRIKNLQETESRILQDHDTLTGDHKVVPLPNANLEILKGEFYPAILDNLLVNKHSIRGMIIKSNKPFLITHQEHGNIALPQGTYMISSQLDPRTLTAMLD